MKKKYLALGTALLALVLLVAGCGSPVSKAVAVPAKADYSLIPVYTLDGRSVYLNATVTPLEFFSVDCPHCQKDLPDIQNTVNGLKAQKPLIYVSTFFKTSNLQDAIQETKDFVAKYKITGTVVIQAGPPQEYVKAVPSLVTLKPGLTTPEITEGMPSKQQLTLALALPTANAPATKKETSHVSAAKK